MISELLTDAEHLLDLREIPWPRGCALLGRMALEEWVRGHSALLDGPLVHASMRSQLLCIAVQVGRAQAARANYLWSALSAACHHHAYELSPTKQEVAVLIREVRDLVMPT